MERIDRPWGSMWLLFRTDRFWIKYLRVAGRTSLQYHRQRDELHIGMRLFAYIPRLKHHRLDAGRYLEFAWGHPDEADIVRLEDDYSRVSPANDTGVPQPQT